MKIRSLPSLLPLLALTSIFYVTDLFASSSLTPARNCSQLRCVRSNIDILDSQIVELLGKRLSYVKRAGELKKGRQAVHDPAREKQILERVSKLAAQNGYPSSIAVAIYQSLLVQTNLYEQKSQNL